MKNGLFLLFLGLASSTAIRAADAGIPQTETQGDNGAAGSASDSASASPKLGKKGYGSEGYGGRADVFVSGFWLFTSDANGKSFHQQATETVGVSIGYRFNLNSWSALEGRYGFANNSQKYGTGGTVISIPTYLSEVTGSYVYNFRRLRQMQPFLEAGVGIVHFRPGNYGTSSNTTGGGSTGTGAPPVVGGGGGSVGPYSVPTQSQALSSFTAPVFGGISLPSQTRPVFAYGAGVDLPAFSRFSVRLEYRGLAYKTPDFKQSGLQTNSFSLISEPSVGVAFRF
jgi:outer membrane immunogenic protein